MSKNNRLKYFLGSALLLFLTATFIKSSFDVFKSKDRLDDLNTDISTLERKKEDIQKEIAFKKTPEYIEETARNDLNMVKPNEIVYVVVKGDGGSAESENVLSAADSGEGGAGKDEKGIKSSNWYSWYKLFFNE